MAQSSKQLVRDLFGLKDLVRIPFIPWVCTLAANIEQVQIQDMLSDAGLLSKSLINAQKLFGYDAITVVFDPSLEAEACGCHIDWGEGDSLPKVISHPISDGASIEDLDMPDFDKRGRLPASLEAAKRVITLKGRDVAIVGVVTGPLTLSAHLKGEAFAHDLQHGNEEATRLITAAGSVALKLCRRYCEMGVDVVAVAEESLGLVSPAHCQAAAPSLRSIWNVARFYNARCMFVASGCTQEHVEPVMSFGADGFALSGSIDYSRYAEWARQRKLCYARTIPDAMLRGGTSNIDTCVSELLQGQRNSIFLSTEWETPGSTDVNSMHEVMRIIHNMA